MRLIDSHCHLNYEGLVERQDEVLDNARQRGVGGFLNISTRQREWNDVIAVAERHSDVWASVGVHPHEADAHPDLGASALVQGTRHPRVIAIGENGDYPGQSALGWAHHDTILTGRELESVGLRPPVQFPQQARVVELVADN